MGKRREESSKCLTNSLLKIPLRTKPGTQPDMTQSAPFPTLQAPARSLDASFSEEEIPSLSPSDSEKFPCPEHPRPPELKDSGTVFLVNFLFFLSDLPVSLSIPQVN